MVNQQEMAEARGEMTQGNDFEEFRASSRIEHPAPRVFDWHLRAGALERLTPPWSGVTVESRRGCPPKDGSRVVLRIPLGPFRARWEAEHRDFVAGSRFRDVQVSGPFALWEHTHSVLPEGEACRLEDVIRYRLPAAPLSTWLASGSVRAMLAQTFAWRHSRTRADLDAHSRAGLATSTIAVSGSGGMVGSQLCAFLGTGGHRVLPMRRRSGAGADEISWNPLRGDIEAAKLDGIDAVVHLAGENIASGRWTPPRKKAIRDSRIAGTALLARTLASLDRPPRTLICASAVGFYGNRAGAWVDEASRAGSGFLADVCADWEDAAEPARRAGIRVVHLRIGVVLDSSGGALASMLPPFRLGLGGAVGSGAQFLSWVSLDDVLGAVLHCLSHSHIEGPVNAVSPHPVTNGELSSALASALHRPALLSLPAYAARALLGEMADELLLASLRVRPTRLLDTGYVFRHPLLSDVLTDTLGLTSPFAVSRQPPACEPSAPGAER